MEGVLMDDLGGGGAVPAAPSPALIPSSESNDFLFVEAAVVDLAVGGFLSDIVIIQEQKNQRTSVKQKVNDNKEETRIKEGVQVFFF